MEKEDFEIKFNNKIKNSSKNIFALQKSKNKEKNDNN
jgi:hypothetical protein